MSAATYLRRRAIGHLWSICEPGSPPPACRLRGECAYSGRDTGQPNRVLANAIAGNKTEWWPGAGKVRLAAAKYEWAEVETILVDETEIGEAPRQGGPGDVTTTMSIFAYKTGFNAFDIGRTAAIALLFVAIVLAVSSPLLWYLFKSTIAERH